jgi:16S rRNA (uracil1498-N3)-methyltransferase
VSLTPYVHLDAPLADVGPDGAVPLTPPEHHHLTRVLRLRDGAPVEVADGAGSAAPAVLAGDAVRLTGPPVHRPPRRPHLIVAQALGKGRKLDEVVRVVTELGVDEVVPVAAERSVTRLDQRKAASALERWRAVARAASEQARRPTRPRITAPVGTDELAARDGVLLLAHPGGTPLPVVVADLADRDQDEVAAVTVAVGPEGGFSDAEVAACLAAGARSVGLGPTVLRTEHAAAAACAVLAAGLGRW